MEKEKIEQLEKKLEQIKGNRFELAMKDTWFDGDFKQDYAWYEEQLKIEKELNQLKKNEGITGQM